MFSARPALALLACLALALPACKKETEVIVQQGEDVVVDRAALAKPADHPGVDAPEKPAANRPSEPDVGTAGAATEVTLEILGLHCEQECAPRVRSMLEHAPGVESVAVDFAAKQARVRVRSGTLPEDVAAAVEGGFTASVR